MGGARPEVDAGPPLASDAECGRLARRRPRVAGGVPALIEKDRRGRAGRVGSNWKDTNVSGFYLRAPAVIPLLRVRWKMRKKMIVGSIDRNDPALITVM